MLELQANPDYETLYCVVDLHATTTPYDPKTLSQNTREVVLDYLASGIDPEKSALYVQSDLADLIAQLAFYFSTVVSVARMQHLPTYKDKAKQHPENVTMALLNYPVLMAADILIYKASFVPVGTDQEPHLEVAREIARKMNDIYGTDFPEPQRFKTEGGYIPSLKGEGKMSKSVEGSFINLTDDLETIKKRLAAAPTDSGQGIIENNELGIMNYGKTKKYLDQNSKESLGTGAIMKFVELFMGEKRRAECEKDYTSKGIKYAELKAELAEAIYKELKPIQERRKIYENDPSLVEKILKEGGEKARKVAVETIREVREKMGLS